MSVRGSQKSEDLGKAVSRSSKSAAAVAGRGLPALPGSNSKDDSTEREAITFYRPMEDREADRAPLSGDLIRRIFTFTRPYRHWRNWLFVLTFIRGLQLPALAWMIGQTINGPIAGRNLTGIYIYAGGYFVLALAMVITLHFRQRLALQLGEAVAHDMRSELFQKLNSMPMSFFNKT